MISIHPMYSSCMLVLVAINSAFYDSRTYVCGIGYLCMFPCGSNFIVYCHATLTTIMNNDNAVPNKPAHKLVIVCQLVALRSLLSLYSKRYSVELVIAN